MPKNYHNSCDRSHKKLHRRYINKSCKETCEKPCKKHRRKFCKKPCITVNAPVRTYLPTVTNSMKWWLAIFLGILFFIIAAPVTYNVTNAVWTTVCLPSYLCAPGCPNIWGVLVHAIIFVILIRIILW